jgi:hypothetical protein
LDLSLVLRVIQVFKDQLAHKVLQAILDRQVQLGPLDQPGLQVLLDQKAIKAIKDFQVPMVLLDLPGQLGHKDLQGLQARRVKLDLLDLRDQLVTLGLLDLRDQKAIKAIQAIVPTLVT